MFRTLDEIKAANKRINGRWFSPRTMRWFSTRLSNRIHTGKGGCFFVTSEQCKVGAPCSPRRYSVRQALPNGEIVTIGEFMGYKSSKEAHTAAAKLAQGGST